MSKIPPLTKYPIRKIAVLRAHKLSEFLAATPALRALHQAFPKAHIDYVGMPWAEGLAPRYHDYLSAFVPFPGLPGLTEQTWQPDEVVAFLEYMQRQKYDLVLQLQGDGQVENPFVALWGAKYSAGFAPPNGFWPSKWFMAYPTEGPEIVRLLNMLAFCGIRPQGTDMFFPLGKDDEAAAHKLPDFDKITAQPYVCIHPGAVSSMPWPARYFSVVADACVEAGLAVVLTGSKEEKELAQGVLSRMSHVAFDLTGETSLGSVAVLLKHSQLFVGNDTGTAHLAVALQVPSITIFSTSDPNRWAPLDTEHHLTVLPDQATPPTVIGDIQAILASKKQLII
jgi:ADP-heptose:LPS heptosyltransferase